MKVIFIDVGKGDCTLIIGKNVTIMIDTGDVSTFNNVRLTLQKNNVNTINALIITHVHEDHAGAYNLLMNEFKIETTYMPKCMVIRDLKHNFVYISSGSILNYGEIILEILAPCRKRYRNLNDYSIVSMLSFGKIKFLMMGDATALSENDIIDKYDDLSCNVLKVGHHGQDDSSQLLFLQKIKPQYSIISNDNAFSSQTVLDRLMKIKSEIYETSKYGNIEMDTDGEKICVKL